MPGQALKICFVGNSRFIGRVCAEAALARGHSVSVLHTGKYPGLVEGASYRVAERDPAAMRDALGALGPDLVLDTQCMCEEDAQALLSASRGLTTRLLVLSSQDVYAQFGRLLGHPGPEPEALVQETSPLTVPFPYRGVAGHRGGERYDKKEVERVLREGAGDYRSVVALRLPAVYGRHDSTRRFGWVLDALDRGEHTFPAIEGGAWRWTHGHIDEIAAASLDVAEAAPEGWEAFNLGDPETPSVGEWVLEIAAAVGVEATLEPCTGELPEAFSHLGAMPNDFVVGTSKVEPLLGERRRLSRAERLSDLVAWLRQSRPDEASSEG